MKCVLLTSLLKIDPSWFIWGFGLELLGPQPFQLRHNPNACQWKSEFRSRLVCSIPLFLWLPTTAATTALQQGREEAGPMCTGPVCQPDSAYSLGGLRRVTDALSISHFLSCEMWIELYSALRVVVGIWGKHIPKPMPDSQQVPNKCQLLLGITIFY